jgi:hypothetical protein
MAEVKFLSFEGLETFLNKLKESFVLKSDYVASNANFLQLKPEDIGHNSQIINIYENDPSNSFLYIYMDGFCKILDVMPSTTEDDNDNSVNCYELTCKVEFLNTEVEEGMPLSISINFNMRLFPDGTLTDPTMMYHYNKSSYCLDNNGDRYSIYAGLTANLVLLARKIELYLAENEG